MNCFGWPVTPRENEKKIEDSLELNDFKNDWRWINLDQLIQNQGCQPEKNHSHYFLNTFSVNEFLTQKNIPTSI